MHDHTHAHTQSGHLSITILVVEKALKLVVLETAVTSLQIVNDYISKRIVNLPFL